MKIHYQYIRDGFPDAPILLLKRRTRGCMGYKLNDYVLFNILKNGKEYAPSIKERFEASNIYTHIEDNKFYLFNRNDKINYVTFSNTEIKKIIKQTKERLCIK